MREREGSMTIEADWSGATIREGMWATSEAWKQTDYPLETPAGFSTMDTLSLVQRNRLCPSSLQNWKRIVVAICATATLHLTNTFNQKNIGNCNT